MAYANVCRKALAAGYRSGIEKDIAKQLAEYGIKADYEPFKIPYTVPETYHKYTPDYVLPNGIVIESKGRFTVEDRKKHLYLQEQYPHLDLRFVFSNARGKLRKGSKTTYADWCEKHGFLYSSKEIPDEWINEKPKRRSLILISKWREAV